MTSGPVYGSGYIDLLPRIARGAAADLEKTLQKAGKQASDGLEKSMAPGVSRIGTSIAATLGAAFSVKVVADFVKGSIAAISDLNESTSKAMTVFGESFAQVDEFAQGAADSVLLSTQAALEATGTFGNLFTAMGLSQKAAAKLSPQVVQLAADLASFNNIGVEEAIEKLRSGLVGETEPLRALGVAITAAAVEAKALELGLQGVNG